MNVAQIYPCDPCKIGGHSSVAVVFCKRCEFCLCKTCQRVHRQAKDTRGHKVVDVHKAMENGLGTRTMNVTQIYPCDPCKIGGHSSAAVVFCKRCEFCLCKTCQRVHRQAKDTRGHKVVDVHKAMENGLGTRCDIHRCTIESVCESHDVLCCRECIATQHRSCHGFTPIQRAAQGIKGTKIVQETTRAIEQLISRFDKNTRQEREALNGVDTKDKAFEESVKKFRKDVDGVLDHLEETLLNTKDELCRDEKVVLEERLKVCEAVNGKLSKAGAILNQLDTKSDDKTTFIVMKKSQEVVDKYKDVAEEIMEGKGKFSIKFRPNRDLVKALDSFGSIDVKSTVQPVGAYEVKPQTTDGRKLVQVGELLVSSPSDEYPCTITGCTLLGESRLVLADETNTSLKVLNNEFKLVADMKMPSAPWDVSAVSQDEVVVRSSFSDKDEAQNRIDIVKVGVDNMRKIGDFTVDGRPRAIRQHASGLYIACSVETMAHILVLDKDYKVTRTVKPRDGVLSQPQYIAITSGAKVIYISDYYNGIIALNIKGEVLFKFKDRHLSEYGGITIDTFGDLYICAGQPYGIYHVTDNGKALTSLTTWKSGTMDPQAIMYNPHDGKFLVTCCTSNKAYIYSYDE